MGHLYLVRHGQASFGAADYDNLSELGVRQSVRLGDYFRQREVQFEAMLTGTLKRHQQTCAGIQQGAGTAQEPLQLPGLNEFDSEAVIAAIYSQPLERPTSPEAYKHHFRLLRDGLTQWMNGVVSPRGMPSYREFVQGVTDALEQVCKNHTGNVLMVSSGGPISTAVGQILRTTPEATIDLNMSIRNSAVTEFTFTPKRHKLLSFNALAHLDAAEYRSWITYT
jgi:broad specificity phosphatase PhoE